MKSDITIVIPVFNRAHTLPRTLASVERQILPPDEVVLVDNNSTDTSMEVMTAWRDKMAQRGLMVTVTSETTPGAASARNKGLSLVRTKYVMFFDSDDVMLPGHVKDFAEALASNPAAEIAGRDIEMRLLDGSSKRGYFRSRDAMFHHIFRGTMSTQRIVVTTELVRRVGGWDTSLRQWDDYELGTRYLLAGPVIIGLPGPPSVITYSQAESLTGTDHTSAAGRWEKALDTCRDNIIRAGRTQLLPWIDTRYAILAAHYHNEGSRQLALTLLEKTLSRTPYPRRIALLYHHNRIFHRLTWVAARILFPW